MIYGVGPDNCIGQESAKKPLTRKTEKKWNKNKS